MVSGDRLDRVERGKRKRPDTGYAGRATGRRGVDETFREQCMAWAKLIVHRRRVEKAEKHIERWLTLCGKPYVAFSGGKDSTVVLDLVRRQKPDTVALTSWKDWTLPETERIMDSTHDLIKIAAPTYHSDEYSAWENQKPGNDVIYYERLSSSLSCTTLYASQNGYDGAALGLRKEEASYRAWHLKRGAVFYCETHQVYECNPIADWTVFDVWAYILSRDIPYNRAYDRLSELGIDPKYQRIGPLAVERVLQYGQMTILKRGWPDLFNRFVAEHPGLRAYV